MQPAGRINQLNIWLKDGLLSIDRPVHQFKNLQLWKFKGEFLRTILRRNSISCAGNACRHGVLAIQGAIVCSKWIARRRRQQGDDLP
jgi:hypothetical protein